ncbi:MAG: hypothetical protein ACYCU0_06520 [Solirubrobacteraceae bacterium]
MPGSGLKNITVSTSSRTSLSPAPGLDTPPSIGLSLSALMLAEDSVASSQSLTSLRLNVSYSSSPIFAAAGVAGEASGVALPVASAPAFG